MGATLPNKRKGWSNHLRRRKYLLSKENLCICRGKEVSHWLPISLKAGFLLKNAKSKEVNKDEEENKK